MLLVTLLYGKILLGGLSMENETKKSVITTGKNAGEALDIALEKLNTTADKILYEVISRKWRETTIRTWIKDENEIRIVAAPPKPVHTPPLVKCPKCGSTQIQMVPRKWSPLNGFMTNKIDRVCVNCKCKF